MKKRMLKKQLTKKNSQKQLFKEKQSIVSILIKWLTWQKVGVILTGLGVVITLANIKWPKQEIEIIKDDIKSNIQIIKDTSHSELASGSDSIYAYYQQQSLQIANLWLSMEERASYTKYVEKGINTLREVLDHDFARENKYNEAVSNFLELCSRIRQDELQRGDSLYSIFSYSKLKDITDALDLKKRTGHKYQNNCILMLKNGAIVTDQKEQKKYVLNAMEELEKMRNDVDYYKFDKLFFMFIVESNRLYLTSDKQHKN